MDEVHHRIGMPAASTAAGRGGVMRSLTKWVLAGAIWIGAATVQAAQVVLNAASATSVSAILNPDAGDVGTAVNVWMGAVYQGVLYMRNGNTWALYSGGPLPIAISGRTLVASTPVTVVENLDISALIGLEIYVGYGASQDDMFFSPGKLAKIYTVSATNPPATANVASITVDAGPPGRTSADMNVPFVSVTICAPGSSNNCQTIDHIDVDTGSTGLRLVSGVVPASLVLPYERDARGNPYGECVQFADGSAIWGAVKVADIRMAGELATSVPIQVAGDPAVPAVPAGCSGFPINTVQSLGANGILGVGYFREDCGSDCVRNPANGRYYVCPPSGCTGAAIPSVQQLAQPVARFSSDNNGVVIRLPAIPAEGADTATGSLVFGIGTQANNGLGAAKVLTVDRNVGFITTFYRGAAYVDSFVDSGSSVLFLPRGAGVPTCRGGVAFGFLCPPAPLNLTAINQGTNGATATVDFSVANANTLLANAQMTAFSNVAAPNSDSLSFDWGLPFFFGRSVFVAIENAGTPGGTGPYVAY